MVLFEKAVENSALLVEDKSHSVKWNRQKQTGRVSPACS